MRRTASRVARAATGPPRLARRVRCSAHRFVRSRALPGGCGGRARDRPAGRAGTRRPVRRGRTPALPGRGHRARRAARSPRDRSGLHHRRATRRRARARRRLGERRVGHRHRVRHGRAAAPGVTMEITTFRSDAYDRVSRNPVVAFGDTIEEDLERAGLLRQRDGGGAHRRAARVRGPVRRARRARERGARHARHAGGVVRRRPAADAARRPVRRAAGVHARSARRRGDDGDGGRAGPDHRRAGAGGAVEADHGRAPAARAGAARRHRPRRGRAARGARHAARDRRAHAAQGRLHALAGRAGAGDRPRDRRAGPRAAPGRAAARHRQARHPPPRAGRRG